VRAKNFLERSRADLTAFLDAAEKLLARADEYTARGGESSLTDFFGTPDGAAYDLTAQQVANLMFSTEQFRALLDSGHRTNFYVARN
jgi:hypothetical protein